MTLMQDTITAAFRQGDPLNALFPDGHSCRRGVCYALCVEWIIRHRANKGESPASRIARVGSRDSVLHASVTQRLYAAEFVNGGWGGLNHKDSQNAAMEHRNLRYRKESWEGYVNYSDSEDMKTALKAIETWAGRTHEYAIIAFDFVRGGGHATCSYKSGGKIAGLGSHLYFFDPNFGEFKVPSGKIKPFFKSLFDRYYNHRSADGTLSRYEVSKIEVRGVTFTT